MLNYSGLIHRSLERPGCARIFIPNRFFSMLRVAINGFGRIGRVALRAAYERKDLQIVAINDLTDPSILVHLLKYDSTFRVWTHDVKAGKDHLVIDGVKIPVLTAMDPATLPWKDLKVDVVIESTGRFT